MVEVGKGSALYRACAVLAFAGSGMTSTWLFYRITDLSLLRGSSDVVVMLAMACAWVAVFPVWVLLFALAMMLVEAMFRRR